MGYFFKSFNIKSPKVTNMGVLCTVEDAPGQDVLVPMPQTYTAPVPVEPVMTRVLPRVPLVRPPVVPLVNRSVVVPPPVLNRSVVVPPPVTVPLTTTVPVNPLLGVNPLVGSTVVNNAIVRNSLRRS